MSRKKEIETTDAMTPRERILAAAKHRFSVDGLSARVVDIVEEAGVNIGAINYYFGNKDALLREVLETACDEVIAERLRLLAEVKRDDRITLRRVIEAWIAPALRACYSNSGTGSFLLQLTRVVNVVEGSDDLSQHLRDRLSTCNDAFIDTLCDIRPDLTRASVSWRMAGMIGVMVFLGGVTDTGLEEIHSNESSQVRLKEALREILPFLVAGFEAPPPATT